ncbi:MAG: RusA family crossover junction endodeoxyribonuclease [Clostridia bacterium]|jgi:Holliday junction resolvase RusA-like endonuclease|uniref:RusA family crossover junction endodeoxyribonuclease n=1 Tax=Intestinibacter bartlettii TaxID=261299 RepID=UPI0011072725|nr:RusA family crossover junction endodeoxyribonuclease [Intestinibacter bartlettii]DAI94219.1 MAG TPA: Endodeoxyribonuclease RusA [Caudoviricetes sp.]
MDRYTSNKNGEGYADNTAYKAIRNVSMTEKNKVRFLIPGEPIAKERPRLGKNGKVYTPRKTHNFETTCSLAYGNRPRLEGEKLRVEILFNFKVPKSYSKKQRNKALDDKIGPTKKDIDNCIKAVLDGLNGIAWRDDRYIHEVIAKKQFAEKSEIIVEITEL